MRVAFRNKHRERSPGRRGQFLYVQSIRMLKKPDECKSPRSLVAISERMILDHEIQKVRCLLLYGRVQFLAPKRLHDVTDDSGHRPRSSFIAEYLRRFTFSDEFVA